jgi:hypothetical protein
MDEEKKPQGREIRFEREPRIKGDVFSGDKHTELNIGGIQGTSGGTINIAGGDLIEEEKVIADGPYINIEPGSTIIIGEQVGAGLKALGDLVQISPEVHAAVTVFRSDFQVACSQVDVLGDYKDLHDLLHQIQFSCYDLLVNEMARFPEDSALEMMDAYSHNLQDILVKLHAVQERALVIASDVAWIVEVEQAQEDLRCAIDQIDGQLLKKTIWRLKRLLSIQPSQVNSRLNYAAHTLRLSSLVDALKTVNEHMVNLKLDPEKVLQFQEGLHFLITLDCKLQALVADHDCWQAIELDLRRIDDQIGQDLWELEMSWQDLKAKAEPLYLSKQDAWAKSLQEYDLALNGCLEAKGSPPKIRLAYRRYRHEAGSHFFQVDVDLKSLCGELRKVGEPLAAILRKIE